MTATAARAMRGELTDKEIATLGQAAYDAGELLTELFEAIEALENVDDGQDLLLARAVMVNLVARIRRDALAKGLVAALHQGSDGRTGQLCIGDLLMGANYTLTPELLRMFKAPAGAL
jgi:hypothetical protein